jgi:hypothetical protein
LLPLEHHPSTMQPNLKLLCQVGPQFGSLPEPVDLRAEGLGEKQHQVVSCIQLCVLVLKTQLLGCFGTAHCTDSTPQLCLKIVRGSGDELERLLPMLEHYK